MVPARQMPRLEAGSILSQGRHAPGQEGHHDQTCQAAADDGKRRAGDRGDKARLERSGRSARAPPNMTANMSSVIAPRSTGCFQTNTRPSRMAARRTRPMPRVLGMRSPNTAKAEIATSSV